MADTIDLGIDGMTCASCVARVERVLRAVPGVEGASVNLATERARVRVGRRRAGLDGALIEAVRRAGYQARTEAGGPAGERLWPVIVSAVLTAPLLGAMVGLALPLWLAALLASMVQFGIGAVFYRAGWGSLRHGSANMDVLVAIGTTAAWGLSIAEWAAGRPGLTYFEAGATVITLVLLGRLLEHRARRATAGALAALQGLQPAKALRVTAAGVEEVALAALRPGDLVRVMPGERLPADGVIEAGEGTLDESLLTGESRPVARGVGSSVIGGAQNNDSALDIRLSATGAETRLARIVRMVEDAQASKPAVQRLVDRVAAVFVPVVVAIALATFAGWLIAGAGPAPAVIAAVSVLVIACPCALGLATPAALLAGIGAAARRGVLFADAAALEAAHDVAIVAFDKTGTLTEGRPRVVALRPAAGIGETDLLRLAGALAAGSQHPLSRAVVAAARERGIALPAASGLRDIAGQGVTGTVEGRALRLGNRVLLPGADASEAPQAALEAASLMWLGEAAGPVLGMIACADAPREGAAQAVAALMASGRRVVLLSGDREAAVRGLATSVGIADWRGGLLPEEKVAAVRALAAEGRVAMVGDGVNDAPALAAASVGIALGSGTDLAMAASGITLMRPDPRLAGEALVIASVTWARLRQGLFWALVYNVVGIPVAALGWLNPMLAGLAMAASSVCVVGNALRPMGRSAARSL